MHMVPVATPVEVVAMPPQARVMVTAAMPAPVQMHVPPQMDMRAKVRQVPAVAVDMTDHARAPDETGPDHTVAATMTDDSVVTTAVRTRVGFSGDKGCQANDGRGDQSEKCSTFEHGRSPFGSMWAIRGIGRKRRAPGSSD
jgi:hypothetical protein